MDIIPAVDVLDGKVVRLERGAYDAVTVYAEDPASSAATWWRSGAPIVHLVDLAGARDGSPSRALWAEVAATGVPFQVGGGIRTVEAAVAAVDCGASRVVLGTAAVWHQEVLAGVIEAVGADRVVAAIDVKGGKAVGAGWLDEGRPVDEVAAGLESAGVRRALVTGISVDGTMQGPDLVLLRRVGESAPGVQLIASGGVGRLEDVAATARAGFGGVIIGRALYERRFTLEEAIAVADGV